MLTRGSRDLRTKEKAKFHDVHIVTKIFKVGDLVLVYTLNG